MELKSFKTKMKENKSQFFYEQKPFSLDRPDIFLIHDVELLANCTTFDLSGINDFDEEIILLPLDEIFAIKQIQDALLPNVFDKNFGMRQQRDLIEYAEKILQRNSSKARGVTLEYCPNCFSRTTKSI